MGKAKILVTDDDRDIRDSLQAILEGEGFDVVTAKNKSEGMDILEKESPDLLILDVMMETMEDGFIMARELKGNPDYKDLPILMLTGVKEETGIDFKSTAGDQEWNPVDGFLDKPVDPEILMKEINKLLD